MPSKDKKEPRQFGVETYQAAKAAMRDLVHLCGGVNRCVTKTRAGQSRLSEALSPQCLDRFPALDQVIDLEADAGDPTVTRFLAGLAGYDLIPIVATAKPAALFNQFSSLTLAVAAVQAQFASAMADGTIDKPEAKKLLSAATQAITQLHDLQAAIDTHHKALLGKS
jgi:hypothetical protein